MSGKKELRFSLTALLAVTAVLCAAAIFFRSENPAPSALAREDFSPAPAGTPAVFEFPSRLRVATYNLCRYRDDNRFSEKGKFLYKYPKPEKEKAALMRTVLEVRPDVLAVQEIGGNAWLDEFADALGRAGLPFPYRALLEGRDKYNRIAVLSRVPFSKTVKIAAPAKLTRGLLGVVIPLAGGESLYVYNVHLKSKVSSDPDDPESTRRRSREARFVRRLIDFRVEDEKKAEKIPSSVRFRVPASLKKNPPKYFVLVGDFNDVPGSAPLSAFEALSFARALPARDGNGGANTFFNPYRGYFFTFDRIFVSPAVFRTAYVQESAKIADFPWARAASDHSLVYADFDFSETRRREK